MSYTRATQDEMERELKYIDSQCDQLELAIYALRQEAYSLAQIRIIQKCHPEARVGRMSAKQFIDYHEKQCEHYHGIICNAIEPMGEVDMCWAALNAGDKVVKLRQFMVELNYDSKKSNEQSEAASNKDMISIRSPTPPAGNANDNQESRVALIIHNILSCLPNLYHPHYRASILLVEIALQRSTLFDENRHSVHQIDKHLGWKVLREFIPRGELVGMIADDIENAYGTLDVSFDTVILHWIKLSPKLTLKCLAEDARCNNGSYALCELWLASKPNDDAFRDAVWKFMHLILHSPQSNSIWDKIISTDVSDLKLKDLSLASSTIEDPEHCENIL